MRKRGRASSPVIGSTRSVRSSTVRGPATERATWPGMRTGTVAGSLSSTLSASTSSGSTCELSR